MPLLRAQLVNIEPVHDEVSSLRRRCAEAEAALIATKRARARIDTGTGPLQQRQHALNEVEQLCQKRDEGKDRHAAVVQREALLMARLDSSELGAVEVMAPGEVEVIEESSDKQAAWRSRSHGLSREDIVEELQDLERQQNDHENIISALKVSERALAALNDKLADTSSEQAACEAQEKTQRAALKSLQDVRDEAETRLASMKSAEAAALKANVMPHVGISSTVTSWPEMAKRLEMGFVLAAGDHVWPLTDALPVAQAMLSAPGDRALIAIEGCSNLLRVDKRLALVIMSPPSPPTISPAEVLREVLGDCGVIRVSQNILDVVNGPSGICPRKDTLVPSIFAGSLRLYQLEGFRWLVGNYVNGFGCLLADDMGLGKTIQTVCFLCYLKEHGMLERPALVVAPSSLLQNWRRELQTWAPSIRILEYTGCSRTWSSRADVVITSYGTLLQDGREQSRRKIGSVGALVFDEAQRVKNHNAGVSRACKLVAARCSGMKVALSGTPVENRLEEVHSIFEVIVPGYLGTLSEFKRTFVPRKDKADAPKLLKLMNPFMLRRLKSDPTVCPELPSKVDMRHDVALTAKQERLYKAAHEHFMTAISSANNGHSRGAQIFAMVHALRKICNHPATYETRLQAFSEPITSAIEESGKTTCFLELVKGILEQGEKCIVFVQYLNTIELLRNMLNNATGAKTVAFTGALDGAQRTATVEEFQTDPSCRVCFATLGAGGVGLNLTAASHVIHFDRCYNPAVEDQGSDRAHRIGQKRTVIVHRLIAQGTFEERIDAIMQEKKHLRELLGDGGTMKWLGDHNDVELRDMFGFAAVSSRKSARDVSNNASSFVSGSSVQAPERRTPLRGRPPSAEALQELGEIMQARSSCLATVTKSSPQPKPRLRIAREEAVVDNIESPEYVSSRKHNQSNQSSACEDPGASGLLGRLAKRGLRVAGMSSVLDVPESEMDANKNVYRQANHNSSDCENVDGERKLLARSGAHVNRHRADVSVRSHRVPYFNNEDPRTLASELEGHEPETQVRAAHLTNVHSLLSNPEVQVFDDVLVVNSHGSPPPKSARRLGKFTGRLSKRRRVTNSQCERLALPTEYVESVKAQACLPNRECSAHKIVEDAIVLSSDDEKDHGYSRQPPTQVASSRRRRSFRSGGG